MQKLNTKAKTLPCWPNLIFKPNTLKCIKTTLKKKTKMKKKQNFFYNKLNETKSSQINR